MWSGPAVSSRTIARRYFVSGVVQGVGFRFFTQRAAEQLGLAGYVRNWGDGRVEIYASGTEDKLEALRALLERGPRGASVGTVNEEIAGVQSEYEGGFSIEYDA
ncbi:MAG: acylphosphatase [Acidobacteriota bacterium]|nr:acylphosphatase [Acidobacteriota bacterium]